MNDYIVKLEQTPEMKKVVSLVIEHFCLYPPTLGHGFSHLVEVARKSVELAVKNKLTNVDVLYLAGLMHDLYRPALDQNGLENHEEKSGEFAANLLERMDFKDKKKEILKLIVDHDDKIISGEGTLEMKILSIADKSSINLRRAVSYTFASNRVTNKNFNPNFLSIFKDFSKYQVLKLTVLIACLDISGVEDGINAYIEANREMLNAIEKELANKVWSQTYSMELLKMEAKLDVTMLKNFKVSEEKTKKITSNYSELIDLAD